MHGVGLGPPETRLFLPQPCTRMNKRKQTNQQDTDLGVEKEVVAAISIGVERDHGLRHAHPAQNNRRKKKKKVFASHRDSHTEKEDKTRHQQVASKAGGAPLSLKFFSSPRSSRGMAPPDDVAPMTNRSRRRCAIENFKAHARRSPPKFQSVSPTLPSPLPHPGTRFEVWGIGTIVSLWTSRFSRFEFVGC